MHQLLLGRTVTLVPGKLSQAKCRSIGNQHSSFAPKKSSLLALAVLYLADGNHKSKHYTTKPLPEFGRQVRFIKRPEEVQRIPDGNLQKKQMQSAGRDVSRKIGGIYTCNMGSSAHAEAALTAILHIQVELCCGLGKDQGAKGKLKLIKIAKQTLGNEILIQGSNPSRGLSHFGRIWHNTIILVLGEDIKKINCSFCGYSVCCSFILLHCIDVYKPPDLHSYTFLGNY